MKVLGLSTTVLYFTAFVLLLVACLTSPLFGPDDDFAIAKVTITENVLSFIKVESHLKLGVFGYCYSVIGKTNHCSSSKLGYELPPLFALLGRVTGLADKEAQASIRSTTKAFVLTPLSCGFTFLAFLVSASTSVRNFRSGGTIGSALATGGSSALAFLLTLGTVIVDIVFFKIAKHHIEDQSERVQVDVSYDSGTWLSVAALVCVLVGSLFGLGSTLVERRESKYASEEEEKGSF